MVPHDDTKTSHETGFVVPRCAICDGTVELVSGDIIIGDKWYHSSCRESEKIKLK